MTSHCNIGTAVIEGLRARNSRAALNSIDGLYTGAQVCDLVSKICLVLKSHGVCPGDRILVENDGDIYFPIIYLAVTSLRCVVVPCPANGASHFGEAYLVERTSPRYAIRPMHGDISPVRLVDELPFSLHIYSHHSDAMALKLHQLDVAALMFTSGTTGEPKGVLVSHKNLCTTLEKNVKFQALSQQTVELITLPITHSFGLGQLLASLAASGMVIIHPGLTKIGAVLKAAKEYRVTSFPTTPAGLRILTGRYSSILNDYFFYVKSIMVNSAPLPADLAQHVMNLLPAARLLVYYGLTEASRSTFAELNGLDRDALSSVGRPLGNTKVTIDSTTGEILIAGDNVSPGYFKDSRSPLVLHASGLLATGDRGEFDQNGRLIINGRISDELNVGGYKIDPLEVERAALGLIKAQNACLTLVEDPGGLPELILLLQRSDAVDLIGLRRAISSVVEPFKVPRRIFLTPSLPTSTNGKLNRLACQQLAKTLIK